MTERSTTSILPKDAYSQCSSLFSGDTKPTVRMNEDLCATIIYVPELEVGLMLTRRLLNMSLLYGTYRNGSIPHKCTTRLTNTTQNNKTCRQQKLSPPPQAILNVGQQCCARINQMINTAETGKNIYHRMNKIRPYEGRLGNHKI